VCVCVCYKKNLSPACPVYCQAYVCVSVFIPLDEVCYTHHLGQCVLKANMETAQPFMKHRKTHRCVGVCVCVFH